MEAALGEQNLMPHILAAVEAGATVGEVCGQFESVFGKHAPVSIF